MQLTRRQQEVCDMIVCGLTNKQIGRRLGLSHRTVEDHRHGIYAAMGVNNAVGLLYKLLVANETQ